MKKNIGFFGKFGGSFISQNLQNEMNKIEEAYNKLRNDKDFIKQIQYIRRTYQGRPTPITFAQNLTNKIGGYSCSVKR